MYMWSCCRALYVLFCTPSLWCCAVGEFHNWKYLKIWHYHVSAICNAALRLLWHLWCCTVSVSINTVPLVAFDHINWYCCYNRFNFPVWMNNEDKQRGAAGGKQLLLFILISREDHNLITHDTHTHAFNDWMCANLIDSLMILQFISVHLLQ